MPLAERPRIVVLNKVDVPEARELAELVRPDLEARGLQVFEVSSASHEGLRELSFAMAGAGGRRPAPRGPSTVPTRIVLRPSAVDEPDFEVTVEATADGVRYRVRGDKPRALGAHRPTSATTRRSATWPTGSPGSASRTRWSRPARWPAPRC